MYVTSLNVRIFETSLPSCYLKELEGLGDDEKVTRTTLLVESADGFQPKPITGYHLTVLSCIERSRSSNSHLSLTEVFLTNQLS